MSETERWRAVPSCPGYEASTLGRVRDASTLALVPKVPGQRYSFNFCELRTPAGGTRRCSVARLVLESFAPPPYKNWRARHVGSPLDDSLLNLRAEEVDPGAFGTREFDAGKHELLAAPVLRRCSSCGSTFRTDRVRDQLCTTCERLR